MPNFDEAFDEPNGTLSFGGGASSSTTGAGAAPAGEAFSRETFLTNEALRRQREARNFVYQGDVDAPKLTRSGRVVGTREDEGEVDEYGGVVESPEVGVHDAEVDRMDVDGESPDLVPATRATISVEETILHPSKATSTTPAKANPIPPPAGARPHVLQILSTLTARHVASNPPAFDDEASNEALQGLVNLLKGTVERGEGNSALLVGPRGVGKTRVSTCRGTAPLYV
jgi:origin recognition complex subunit 4